MTNEWKEFKSYVEKPIYASAGKKDRAFMGRFTLEMISDFTGFSRVFTIIARRYLFHDKDGNVLPGDPYERIGTARNALLAWCSVPDRSKREHRVKVDFRELSDEFPDLVDADGKGWFYSHVKSIIRFIADNPDLVIKPMSERCSELSRGFNAQWKKRVRHFQVPIFASGTKSAWGIRFDDMIAEALEVGPLRTEEYRLPPETDKMIDGLGDTLVKKDVLKELARFYLANKPEDSEWVVLPVVNFNAYYGTTSFERKWLPDLPPELFVRENRLGVCRFKLIMY